MLHCLHYWPYRWRSRKLRSESEWESALAAIPPTLLMVARPTATMVRAGSRMGSSSARAPGTTVGDIHITDEAMLAALQPADRLPGAGSTEAGSAADGN